jgi:hypothetical protein
MVSDEQRRIEILQYIKNRQKTNRKTTKIDVVRHMKEEKMASGETTHNTMRDLITEGKINVEEVNTQLHYLTINEQNEFNRIYSWLLRIEKTIDLMYEPAEKITSMGDPDTVRKIPDRFILRDLDNNFLGGYQDSTNNILEFLLFLTSNKIKSEKDALFLYNIIIKLKIKVDEQASIFEAKGIENKFLGSRILIDYSLDNLEHIHQDAIDYAKKKGLIINKVIDNTKSMIKDFKKEFLLPQKSAKKFLSSVKS